MTVSPSGKPRSRPVFPRSEGDGFYKRLRHDARSVVALDSARPKLLTLVQVVFYPLALASTYAVLLLRGESLLWLYGCYAAFGILVPFAVLNIVHPAVHLSLFRSARANRLAAHLMDLLGANSFVWAKRHVQMHHTYTNIPGWDVDIDGHRVIRLAPSDPLRRNHRYQHLYMPLVYLIYTLNWFLFRDFRDAFSRTSVLGRNVTVPRSEHVKLFVFKAFYLAYMIGVPALLLTHAWPTFVFGFLLSHAFTGTITLLIVLPTHFDEHAPFPEPDEETSMQEEWAVHQIHTTNDYSTERPLFSFIMGGLNHHVAHHLFPAVNHNALPRLTPVVKAAAEAQGLPYKSFTYLGALRSHFRLLKRNGMRVADILEE